MVWDAQWYAGHALPGYSLLFAPLARWWGCARSRRCSVLVSAALFERLVLGVYGRRLRVRPAPAVRRGRRSATCGAGG